MTKVAECLDIRMFGSISPDNYASMASAKASNDIKIHKTLENGYYYRKINPDKLFRNAKKMNPISSFILICMSIVSW